MDDASRVPYENIGVPPEGDPRREEYLKRLRKGIEAREAAREEAKKRYSGAELAGMPEPLQAMVRVLNQPATVDAPGLEKEYRDFLDKDNKGFLTMYAKMRKEWDDRVRTEGVGGGGQKDEGEEGALGILEDLMRSWKGGVG